MLVVTSLVASVVGVVPTVATATTAPSLAASSSTSSPAGPAASNMVSAAQASTRARASGKPVVATALTTATAQTVANPNGSLTLSESAVPTRVWQHGAWVNLDPTLHMGAGNTVAPIATSDPITLSGGGSGPLASLFSGGRGLSLTLPVTLPLPVLAGPSATYHDVIPGVDLTVTVQTSGAFSDVFTVRTPAAAQDPRLATLLSAKASVSTGMTVSADSAGNLVVADAGGHGIFTAPDPKAWDSATTATPAPGSAPGISSQSGPGIGANETQLAVTVNQDTITLVPPTSILSDPSADFPIYLDPTFSPNYGNTGWASPGAGFPNDNHWDSTVDPTPGITQIGNSGGPEREALSLFDFPIDLGTLGGAHIFSASFGITETHSWACLTAGHDQTVDLYAPADTLVSSNGTWNDWIPNLGASIGNQNFALGGSSACPAAGIPAFGVTLVISNDVAAGKGTQTLVMRANNGSDNFAFKEFQANTANLTVTYDKVPNTPSGLTTFPTTNCVGSALGDTAVALYAPESSPVNVPLTTTFNLYKTADGTRTNLLTPANGVSSDLYSGGSGQAAVAALPESFFKTQAGGAATSFSWLAQTTDGTLTSGWSNACSFTWDPTRPGPAVISPNPSPPNGTRTCATVGDTVDPTQQVGTNCSFTLTPPSGGAISGYSYQVDQAPPVTVSATGATTITVPLIRLVNTLTVNTLSAGGNFGAPATARFDGTTITPPAKDGDVTNDGTPDLIVPGGPGTALPPGLWLSRGSADGTVSPDAVDIGGNGLGINAGVNPTEWNGAQAITGDFCGFGAQDVVAYFPSGANAGGGDIACNDGSSDPLHLGPPTNLDSNSAPFVIGAGTFQDASGNNAIRIAGAGNATGTSHSFPDVFATINNQLFLFTSNSPNGYTNDVTPVSPQCSLNDCYELTGLNTPDGSQDWNAWTITTVQLGSSTAMYLWNAATGQLDLWTGLSLSGNGSTLSTTGTYLIATNWNTNVAGLVLRAADIKSNGIPDLWATNVVSGTTTAYIPASLANQPVIGTATTGLTAPTHGWQFQDIGGASGSALASTADDVGGLNLRGAASGVVWNKGDVYSPDALLNTGSDGTTPTSGVGRLWTTSAAVDLSSDFTVAVHVKPNKLGGIILAQNGANSSGLLLYPDVSGKWFFCLSTSDTVVAADMHYDCASGGQVQMGAWTWVAAAYKASTGTMTLYVNGVATAAATHTAVTGFGGSFEVGDQFLATANHYNYFSGQVADIQVWNTALAVPLVQGNSTASGAMPAGGTLGDVNGDGRPDILAIDSTGLLWLYPNTGGAGTATFGARIQVGEGWTGYTLDAVADLYHSGHAGILATAPDGTLHYYVSVGVNGIHTFTSDIVVNSGWTGYRIVGLTDIYGTGSLSILTVDPSGSLWLYPNTGGTGTSTFGARIQMGSGWLGDTLDIADINGDGKPDLLAVDAAGNLWCYPNISRTDTIGAPIFGNAVQMGTGWRPWQAVDTAAMVPGHGADIIAIDNNGILLDYSNAGGMNMQTYAKVTQVGAGWTGFRIN
jgi:hypothetical protein